MFYVVFCIAYSDVYYLNESFSISITLDGEGEMVLLLSVTRNFVVSV